MSDEHTRKFQCEYYTVYARPNSCFFCDNCNDIIYDYRNGYASPYMWLCDKGNDTEAGMMGKCQDFYEDAEQTENSSEKPNNCEHITEDGVTCAKYPACDDCLDNPLNKVKGSERLLKGKDEPQKKEVEWVYNKRERLWYPYSNGELLFKDEPQTERSSDD